MEHSGGWCTCVQLDKLEQLTVRLEQLTHEAVPRDVVAKLGMGFPHPAALLKPMSEEPSPSGSAGGASVQFHPQAVSHRAEEESGFA